MYVDDNIVREFLQGHRTAKWMRTYLLQLLETTPEPEDGFDTGSTPPTTKQRIQMMLESNKSGQFFLTKWEKDFLSGNVDMPSFSESQMAHIDKLWRRITS